MTTREFDWTGAATLKHNGSPTSIAAALDNAGRAGTQRRRVMAHILEQGTRGATREEIALALGLSDNAVRPRIVELMERGLLRSYGTRKTRLGCQAEVLFAAGVRP